MKLRITTLVEDTVDTRLLLAEHGLAYWIELGRRRLLFDCGQGMALSINAHLLDIHLEQTEAILLSHGHYDHSGGLADALRYVKSSVPIFLHPAALRQKYVARPNGDLLPAGMPWEIMRNLKKRGHLIFTKKITDLGDGLFLTGAIPRRTDFEDVGGPFFSDAQRQRPDLLPDDQAAFIVTKRGIIVILGCAHAGVINTLEYIRKLNGKRPILAVLGGMHLHSASPERIQKTIEALQRLGSPHLHPCHCTGFVATASLWQNFAGRCAPCPVGTVLEWKNLR